MHRFYRLCRDGIYFDKLMLIGNMYMYAYFLKDVKLQDENNKHISLLFAGLSDFPNKYTYRM